MNPRFEAGQFITFTYRPPPKPAPKQRYRLAKDAQGQVVRIPIPMAPQPPPSDPTKQVLVLHPNWQGKVHAIDLGRITPAEVQTLRAVMDPETKAKVDAGQWPVEGVPPYNLIRDILTRMDPVELIKNPLAFYQRLVKPFIRDKDCYRLYFPQYISGVRVVEESKVKGQVTNPAPLFKKI